MADGRVNRASASIDLGLGVRARVGYNYYTEDRSLAAMLAAVCTAAEIAMTTPGRAPVTLQVLGLPSYYPVKERWAGVGMERQMTFTQAKELRQAMRSSDVGVVTGTRIGGASATGLVLLTILTFSGIRWYVAAP